MSLTNKLLLGICAVIVFACKQNTTTAPAQPQAPKDLQYQEFEGIVTKAELQQEINIKLQRVQQFLKDNKLGGVLLSVNNNFSWLTAGIGDNHIVITSSTGDASLLIMADGKKYLLANNTEIAHLMDEDLKGLGYEAKGFEWYDQSADKKMEWIKQLAKGAVIGTDTPYGDLKLVDAGIAALRYQLTDSEIKKYTWVGQQASQAVAATCKQLSAGMSERDIEAMASAELMKRHLRPTVVLIGADDRLMNYYHYPPTERILKNYVFVNVCARRWGLVASVGRYVYLGTLPDSLRKANQASAEVCARMEAASKPGVKASDIFKMTKQWYADAGYPGYWKKIHVGGGIGYLEREWLASDYSKEILHQNQALAWNPFTLGALSFDTIIITKDGIKNITGLSDWPSVTVNVNGVGYRMPQILVR